MRSAISRIGWPGAVIGAVIGLAALLLLSGGDRGSVIGGPARAEAALTPFDSCDEIHAYALDHPWALGRGGGYPIAMALEDTAAAPTAASGDSAVRVASGLDSAATTNVQEAGIDEPDIVKSDGETIFAISDGSLHAVAADGRPTILGSVALPGSPGRDGYIADRQMLIGGGRALVVSQFESYDPYRTGVLVIEVDISDPAAMTTVRTQTFEGRYLSGRAYGDTARLVISAPLEIPVGDDQPGDAGSQQAPSSSPPSTGAAEPSFGGTGVPEPAPAPDRAGAEDVVTDAVAPEIDPAGQPKLPTPPNPTSEYPSWMPAAVLHDMTTGDVSRTPLLECDQVSFPERFSGLDLLTVLTIDLASGLRATDADAVVAGGETVYASSAGLYVATQELLEPQPMPVGTGVSPDDPVSSGIVDVASGIARSVIEPALYEEPDTAIHRFDTTDPSSTSYAASGTVEGRVLNQFSMSEQEGYLRVATTTGSSWADGAQASESFVTVLREEDGRLEQSGRIGGLGRGEEIYAVRFLGDRGYVVTFEQTDPLYVLDLSDPEQPTLGGELKIPGYSSYLHPVGDDLLLGVGQDADAGGATTGAQVSLFDVSDPAAPTRIDQLSLGRWSYSDVEYDHHAFQYWPQTGIAFVPIDPWSRGPALAYSVHVSESGLDQANPITDNLYGKQIDRAFLLGDSVFTMSPGGIAARDPETLIPTGGTGFGGQTTIVD